MEVFVHGNAKIILKGMDVGETKRRGYEMAVGCSPAKI